MKRLYSFIISSILVCVSLTAQNFGHYYSCDFENEADCARWVLTPTASESIEQQIVNKWYIGELTNNTLGGKKSMYISNDGGHTYEYTAQSCWSMAYDIVQLDPLVDASYLLSFEYRAMGNVSDSDGIFVFWMPMEDPDTHEPVKVMSIPTSDKKLPAAYENYVISLQPLANMDYVNGTTTWRQCVVPIPKKKCNGEPYYLVFAWRNGSSLANQPGAAIDNIEISDERPCNQPTHLKVAFDNGLYTMTWKGTAPSYEVSAYSYDTDQWFGPVEVTSNSYSFGGLPVSETDFIVRAKCDENLYSLKTMENKLVYYPDRMCVDYLNLDNAVCYISDESRKPTDTRTYNNFIKVAPVDDGPGYITSRHTIHFNKRELEIRTGKMASPIPDGELASVRLGNWNNQNQAERIEFTFEVDTISYPVLLLKYMPLLEAPGHDDKDNPRFKLDILIGNQSIGTCGQADFNCNDVYKKGELLPGAEAMGWHITPKDIAGTSADVVWKEWTTVGVNLKNPAYQGKKLTARLTTHDCTFSAHSGYAYFTLGCSDGKLKGMECARINPEFIAPDGFVYRWFYAEDEKYRMADGKMPEAFVRGHSQSFYAGMHDNHLYAVDCMFVQDSSCFFTLYASTLATNPIPVTSSKRISMDCENFTYTYHLDASKSYIQEIDHVTNDTIVSKRHKIEFMEWNFGDGKHDYSKEVDHVFQAFPDKDTTYIVTLYTRFMTCEKTDTIRLFLPAVTNYTDTTVAYLCDKDIKSGEGYVWEGKRYTTYTLDSVIHERTTENACDTILYLDLREPIRDTLNKLIFDYESVIFHGVEYNQTGIYEYVSPNCDTAAVLNLRVYETLNARLTDTLYTVCSGTTSVALKYIITKGTSNTYSNKFEDSLSIKPIVREPLITEYGAGEVIIPLPNGLYPNRYTGWLTLHDTLPEQDVVMKYLLTVNYPDTVLTQRWNDVLAVRNAEYNGGYEFTNYQWYKNGIAIDGATGSYLYVPEGLDFTAEYAAEVTRSTDQVQLFTCPVIPQKVDTEKFNDIPTLVPRNAPLQIKGVGTARWFTALGVIVSAQNYNDSPILSPSASGSYLLHVTTSNGPVKTYHVVVW